MNREDIQKLALDLADDLKTFCPRDPEPQGADDILRLAANASSWRDVIRHYCRQRKPQDERRSQPEERQDR